MVFSLTFNLEAAGSLAVRGRVVVDDAAVPDPDDPFGMGRDVFVLGSVGPLGKYLAPLGSIAPEDARAAFLEQAEGLLEGGVDAFVVETQARVRKCFTRILGQAP